MRRPLRNIEIFSMSVLDMFASALGAFIMVAVILFPYFNQSKQLEQTETETKGVRTQIEKLKETIKDRDRIIQSQKKDIQEGTKAKVLLDRCNDSIARCKEALTQTFLVVVIEWDARADVDLHLTDPRGNEYSYRNATYPGSTAQLSLDMTDGPGIEVWQNPRATPGTYGIVYNLYSAPADSGPVSIRGWVIDRSGGRRELPTRQIATTGSMLQVARLRVNSDGSTDIQPAN